MSNERELSVAVVGLGFGAIHARVLGELEGVRLAAICDTDEQRLSTAARGRLVRTYTDFREMLRAEPLDGLVVAVPTRIHKLVAMAAIEVGVSALVEKPLAPTVEEGRVLADAGRRAGVPLMAGHIERFNPAVQELKRRLESGEAGRVLQVTARRLGPFAVRTRDVSVIHDLAFHDIDIMRYLLDAEVERVFAETQTGVRTSYDDSLAGTIRFRTDEARGVIGLLEVNWLTPRKVRELDVLCEYGLFVLDYLTQALEFHQSEVEGARSDGGQNWPALANLVGHEAGPVVRLPVEPREPLERELSAFVAALRHGSAMPVSTDDALATLTVADALAESARTGVPVRPTHV